MYRRILLAFDGTIEGARALREGALVARRCRAEVFLLSVVPQTSGIVMAEAVSADLNGAESIREAQELLERGASRLEELGFAPVTRLLVGEPTHAIAGVAREIEADLVVVGHRAKGSLSRWWTGSNKDYLSDHVGCSLLIACTPISDEDFEAEVEATRSD